jgi:hypothetical protein
VRKWKAMPKHGTLHKDWIGLQRKGHEEAKPCKTHITSLAMDGPELP